MKKLEDEQRKEEQQLLSSSSCPSSPPPNSNHFLPSFIQQQRRYSQELDLDDDDKFPVLIKGVDGKFNTKFNQLSISRPSSTQSNLFRLNNLDLDFNIPSNPPYPLTSPNPPNNNQTQSNNQRSQWDSHSNHNQQSGQSQHNHQQSNQQQQQNSQQQRHRSLTPIQNNSNSSNTSGNGNNSANANFNNKKSDQDLNKFIGVKLEDIKSEIYNLCKDQHGCRFLQKKLEDDDELDELSSDGQHLHARQLIFNQIFNHFSELMTDPFGNYLCQKMLEFANDLQRDILCESVSQELVSISLNMHGTRAVQKMIDYLSTKRQIQTIIMSLSLNVVTLIKDLNGNHVIQKCLNRLIPNDNQFIYNAVAQNCIEVATHRHGCCVLQRCIDHASDHQRVQLVSEITYHALTLIQDPFGNYVVQYVLDLNDNRFSDAVIRQFLGHICALSVQKFSSNVIEKCIRVADTNVRSSVIDELNNRQRLEKLLRDAFGNYVVQTALDFAEPVQRIALVEAIRPIIPMIRNTPYGKRIQSKLQRASMFIRDSSDPTFGLRSTPSTLQNNGQNFRSASASNFSNTHSPLLGMSRSISSHGLDYGLTPTPNFGFQTYPTTALAAAAHHQHAQQLAALASVNDSRISLGHLQPPPPPPPSAQSATTTTTTLRTHNQPSAPHHHFNNAPHHPQFDYILAQNSNNHHPFATATTFTSPDSTNSNPYSAAFSMYGVN